MNIDLSNPATWITIVVILGAIYLIAKSKKKKDRKDMWRGYKRVGEFPKFHNNFADALIYIKKRNPVLHDRIDRKLDIVYFTMKKSTRNSEGLMSAPLNGNYINVHLTEMVKYPGVKSWARTIIHEFVHLEGLDHGPEMNKEVSRLRRSVGINY